MSPTCCAEVKRSEVRANATSDEALQTVAAFGEGFAERRRSYRGG